MDFFIKSIKLTTPSASPPPSQPSPTAQQRSTAAAANLPTDLPDAAEEGPADVSALDTSELRRRSDQLPARPAPNVRYEKARERTRPRQLPDIRLSELVSSLQPRQSSISRAVAPLALRQKHL